MDENQAVSVRKPMSGFERIVKIIFSPTEVFESIERKPNFILPMVITIVVTGLITFFTKDLMAEYTKQLLLNQGLDSSQLEATLEATKTLTQVSLVLGVIFSFLSPLIKGLVSHLFSLMFGGEGKVDASVSVVLNAYMIVMLGSLLSLPIVVLTQNPVFSFSAAVFLPTADAAKPLYTLLSSLNVFTIWYLIVSIMGFKKVHKYSTMKASLAVIIPFILMLLVSFGGVIMGTMAGA